MTRQESRASYAIIRHNVRTYVSAGVVEVVRGQQNATLAMREVENCQSSEDRQLGWRYFLEETDLQPGMNPEEATQLRWAAQEARENKAISEQSSPVERR